jgi:protoporphyrinogen oxidase
MIIGAGLTGLTAAYCLKKQAHEDFAIFERSNSVGGVCKSIEYRNYVFDLTGHALHLRSNVVKDFVFQQLELQGKLLHVERKAGILYKNVIVPYPFQKNLFYLPARDRKRCFVDYVKAQFALSSSKLEEIRSASFDSYTRKQFGDSIVDSFLKPYNEKLWCIATNELSTTWLGQYFPKVNLEEVIESTLEPKREGKGYNSTFYYPEKGGIQTLVKALAEPVEDHISRNSEIVSIDLDNRRAQTQDGKWYPFDILINTSPLKDFATMCQSGNNRISSLFARAGTELRATSVTAFLAGMDSVSERYGPYSWLYLPEKKYFPYRVGIFNNFSSNLSPNGKVGVYAEKAQLGRPTARFTANGEDEFRQFAVQVGLVKSEGDIDFVLTRNIYPAYCIYDGERDELVDSLLHVLREQGVYSIGRYGAWKYAAMEDCILDALETVHRIARKKRE